VLHCAGKCQRLGAEEAKEKLKVRRVLMRVPEDRRN